MEVDDEDEEAEDEDEALLFALERAGICCSERSTTAFSLPFGLVVTDIAGRCGIWCGTASR